MKAATSTSASNGRRARRAAAAPDLSSALGILASALARAAEMPGKLADAAELRARLEANRTDLEVSLENARREAASSGHLGRDFGARRASATAVALLEEIADVDAMLEELGRVERRLVRETRTVEHRLGLCAALASALPASSERSSALEAIERSRRLLARRTAPRAASLPAYTFILVEAKQSGSAR